MLINKDSIILRRPERGFNFRKLFSFVNVLFFWGLTVYLMRSLLSVLGWGIVSVIFGRALGDSGFHDTVQSVFAFYLPLILVSGFTLWLWAGYNHLRYSGTRDKRRVHPPYLTMEQVGDYTRLPAWKIRMMQNSKIVVCHFDEKRELRDVDCFGTIEQCDGEESVEDLVEVDCFLNIDSPPARPETRPSRVPQPGVESRVGDDAVFTHMFAHDAFADEAVLLQHSH